MKKFLFLTTALVLSLILFSSNVNGQTKSKGNTNAPRTNWVDKNGDGICDNIGTGGKGFKGSGNGYGKKDGSCNHVRPMDGTGYGKKGAKAARTGICDGTGPKGSAIRRGNK